ncbi:MAG: hypothetical protein H6Q00_3512 [Holophagaceae bacterium]|nr:hypothetical protein [Holophagaceae bacterium]
MKPGVHSELRLSLVIQRASILSISLGLSLGLGQVEAAESLPGCSFGIQAGVAIPAGRDLGVTVGSRLNGAVGVHATWSIGDHHGIRPRLDLWDFSQGHQEVLTPFAQQIETKVQGIALGGEYLYRPGGLRGRLAAGGGLYLIRWSVDSTNRLDGSTGGTAQASGTSHWTRDGVGLVVSFRLTPRLDGEARWIFSSYGYEDLPANLCTAGLLWRF